MKNIIGTFLILLILPFRIYSQELTPEKIFEQVDRSIVVVYTYDFDGKLNKQGSGIILSDKGILVTNFHIFAGCEKIEIKKKDSLIKHEGVLGINIEKDILILKLSDNNYPTIPICNSDTLKVGQKVYTIGSPMGLENTMSEGIISGLRTLGKFKNKFIQITASLSPGSSGGAVLNSLGELIGISSRALEEGENLNFAIPIKEVMKVNSGVVTNKKTLEAMNYFYIGYNEYGSGKYEESIDNYTKYIEISTIDPKVYNYRGLAYTELKKYKEAIADFTKAIKLDTSYVAPFSNRADVYVKLEDYENAAKDLTKVIKHDPQNVYAYYARGIVYSKDENYRDAIKDFTKVIKLDPTYVSAYINRGLACYYIQDYDGAMEDWHYAIKLDPSLGSSLRVLIDNADYMRMNR